MIDNQKICGEVLITIDYENGEQKTMLYKNAVVKTAKEASVLGLVNQIGDSWQFYIDKMIFGTNGTSGSTPKVVEDSRNGLFGTTLLSKSVSSTINASSSTQAIFTTVIAFSEGNGSTINEMALVMKDGNLYSMMTFTGIAKTSAQQIIINWKISML